MKKESRRITSKHQAMFMTLGTLALFVGGETNAASIELGDPVYGGTGCPQGSASAAISPDGKALTVLFDRFSVEVGGNTGIMNANKNCDLGVPVKVPAGYTVAVFSADYRGFSQLPAGGTARFSADSFFAGQPGASYVKDFQGPLASDYKFTTPMDGQVWSNCGESVILRTRALMQVSTNSRRDEASVSVDSIDIKAGITYQIEARPCSSNLPPPTQPGSIRYEAERDLNHQIGYADGDGWAANTRDQNAGYLTYGPYAKNWGTGSKSASFRLMVDNNTADDSAVVTLDVYDSTAGEVLARREVRRRQLKDAYAYQDFILDFDMTGREGHAMEARVLWHDTSYVKVDTITIQGTGGTTPPPPSAGMHIRYEAERDLNHQIGYVDGDGWAVNTRDQKSGYMIFGPYAKDWGTGAKTALFRMLLDNTTADNGKVLVVDIYDSDKGQSIARREMTRRDFGAAFTYQDFSVDFDMTGREGHAMEVRVYTLGISYIRVDSVTVQGR